MQKMEIVSTYSPKEIKQMISKHLNIPVEFVHLGVIKDEVKINGEKYERYIPALSIYWYR